MEPSELAQFINTLAQLMTAGGAHVYGATRQSVMISVWRNIAVAGTLCCLSLWTNRYLWGTAKAHQQINEHDDTREWLQFGAVLAAVCFSAMATWLVIEAFNLGRIDYLTIEELRTLIR